QALDHEHVVPPVGTSGTDGAGDQEVAGRALVACPTDAVLVYDAVAHGRYFGTGAHMSAGAPRRQTTGRLERTEPAAGAAGGAGVGWEGGSESLDGCEAGTSERSLVGVRAGNEPSGSLGVGGTGGQGHDAERDDDVEQDCVDGHDFVSSDPRVDALLCLAAA